MLGPGPSLGPMIAATILPLAGADGDPNVSKPTMIGHMNGLANALPCPPGHMDRRDSPWEG